MFLVSSIEALWLVLDPKEFPLCFVLICMVLYFTFTPGVHIHHYVWWLDLDRLLVVLFLSVDIHLLKSCFAPLICVGIMSKAGWMYLHGSVSGFCSGPVLSGSVSCPYYRRVVIVIKILYLLNSLAQRYGLILPIVFFSKLFKLFFLFFLLVGAISI